MSTDESNDSIGTFRRVSGWLRGVGVYPVSDSIFSCLIDTDVLDLYLYRFDLDADGSMAGFNDPIQMFREISGWLRGLGTSAVSRFAFSSLADFYRLNLEPSASTPWPNKSIWMFCGFGWWLGRHR